ncbi:MAG: T9SS type A sorting domain-containing protein, partial [Ignavibacteriales bacterium]|nr:T9SS type A sorting domain-containing protein [Ignavibacteriales bacterium]
LAYVKDDPTLIDSSDAFGVVEPSDAAEATDAPASFALAHAYPNPFNPTTTISYAIPVRADVTLRIFDVSGRLIRSFELGEVRAGRHRVVWDGADERGARAASGVYVYRIEAIGESGERFAAHEKMIMLK